MHRRHDSAQHQSRSSAALPYTMGAGRSNSWNPVQRLHDVQARVGELGPPNYLADHRTDDLFYLQPLPQPGQQSTATVSLLLRQAGRHYTRSTFTAFNASAATLCRFRYSIVSVDGTMTSFRANLKEV